MNVPAYSIVWVCVFFLVFFVFGFGSGPVSGMLLYTCIYTHVCIVEFVVCFLCWLCLLCCCAWFWHGCVGTHAFFVCWFLFLNVFLLGCYVCICVYVCIHIHICIFWVVQCVVCICLMFVVDTNAERAYFFVICLLFCFLSAHISVCHVYRAICT